jgi:hypothetical protein
LISRGGTDATKERRGQGLPEPSSAPARGPLV